MVSLQDADRSAIYDAGHHEMVMSERIAHTKHQSEILSNNVRRKITRYIARWHKEQDGKWPAVPASVDSIPSVWFSLEPVWDRSLYRILRTLDWGIVFIYCFAPLWLLRKYRVSRGRGETVVMREKSLAVAPLKD
jgi:hypothetical protein